MSRTIHLNNTTTSQTTQTTTTRRQRSTDERKTASIGHQKVKNEQNFIFRRQNKLQPALTTTTITTLKRSQIDKKEDHLRKIKIKFKAY